MPLDTHGSVTLREADTGKVLTVLRGHEAAVNSVAFAPDGQTLASGEDERIQLWDDGALENARRVYERAGVTWSHPPTNASDRP